MGLKHLEDVTYFRLNNEINRPVNGQIMLHKDKEALDAFFKENVVPNTMVLIQSRIKSTTSLNTTTSKQPLSRNTVQSFWKNCLNLSRTKTSNSSLSWLPINFTNQYALKTNDGEYYLESMEDRVFFNALYFADGDEAIAIDIANEIIHQRYQPATPSFLNAGRARRGVSILLPSN